MEQKVHTKNRPFCVTKNRPLCVILCVMLAGCMEGGRYARVLDRAQEQNLAYDSITGIDSLQMAVRYYDRHGSDHDKVRAYYLLGCAYRDAGEAPNALEAYHEAAARADTTSGTCDYGLLTRVHAQSAMLFRRQGLPHEMLEELRDQRHCALLADDDLNAINAVERMGDAYYLLNETDSMIRQYRRASELYEQYGFHEEAAQALGPIIYPLVERGDTAEARRCIERYETSRRFFRDGEPIPEKAFHYFSKGLYAMATGRVDSAEVYFRRLLDPALDAQQREAGYRGLFLLYSPRVSPDSMAKYANLLYEQALPVLASVNREKAQQMQGLYNYSRFQQRERQAAERSEQQQGMIIILLVAVIALGIVAVGVARLLGFVLRRPHYEVNVNSPGNQIVSEQNNGYYKN